MPDPRKVNDNIAVPDHDLMTADEVVDYFRVSKSYSHSIVAGGLLVMS